MEIKEVDAALIPLVAFELEAFHDKLGLSKFTEYDEKSVTKSLFSITKRGGKCWALWDGEDFHGFCLGVVSPCILNHNQKIASCLILTVSKKYKRTQWVSKLMKEFESWGKENEASVVTYGGDAVFERKLKRKGYTKVEAKLMKEL